MLPFLTECGVDAVGLCTRYIANDSALMMENCVLDVASAIASLRRDGYEKVVLVGNSGGGGLAALYQSQAESPTIRSTPAGDPPDLTDFELQPADGVVFFMAHPGRSMVFTDWLDPAITDESKPFDRVAELDMFNAENGPPYSPEFLERYRAAQIQRNRRITKWVHDQLDMLAARGDGIRDLPFTIHGTLADPRFLDLTIDPSDRAATTSWGAPAQASFSPLTLAHYSTLRSWLSQWSYDESNGDGRVHAARISVPVFVMYGSADEVCFPSYGKQLYEAVSHHRKKIKVVEGATHHYHDQDALARGAAADIVEWARKELK
jgi:alpha-beta hydrolase superfamily lysophospholipase